MISDQNKCEFKLNNKIIATGTKKESKLYKINIKIYRSKLRVCLAKDKLKYSIRE